MSDQVTEKQYTKTIQENRAKEAESNVQTGIVEHKSGSVNLKRWLSTITLESFLKFAFIGITIFVVVAVLVMYEISQSGIIVDFTFVKWDAYAWVGICIPLIVIYLVVYVRTTNQIHDSMQVQMEPYYPPEKIEIFNNKNETVDDLDDDKVNEKRYHGINMKMVEYIDIPDDVYDTLSGEADPDVAREIIENALKPENLKNILDKRGNLIVPDGREKYYYRIPLDDSIWIGESTKEGLVPHEFIKGVFALPTQIEKMGHRWARIVKRGFTVTDGNTDKWAINLIAMLTNNEPFYDVESCEHTRRNKMQTYKSIDIHHGPARVGFGLYIQEIHANESLRGEIDTVLAKNDDLKDQLRFQSGVNLKSENPDLRLDQWKRNTRKASMALKPSEVPVYWFTAITGWAVAVLLIILHLAGVF